MGVTTDFIGCVEMWPPLNHHEQAYLSAFSQSRRHRRPGGPYEVSGNPAAERSAPSSEFERDAFDYPGEGQPSLWCQWTPTMSGERLVFDGREKFYGAAAWMQYLIDHFLVRDGYAASSTLPYLAAFSFDHVVDGLIAASQQDTGELYVIAVEENVVHAETLWRPRHADNDW